MLIPEHHSPELHHTAAVTGFPTGVNQDDSRLLMTNENRAPGVLLPTVTAISISGSLPIVIYAVNLFKPERPFTENPFLCGCAFELAERRKLGLSD